jgi:hypothetical protein
MAVEIAIVPVEFVERRIYLIRGHKGMLDRDLAELYQAPDWLCGAWRDVMRPEAKSHFGGWFGASVAAVAGGAIAGSSDPR